MTNKHLNDDEIQDYCLNNNSDAIIEVHIQQCEDCNSKIAAYKALFTSIKQQPIDAFDFNLTALVMEQLPVKKEKASFEGYFIGITVIALILSAGISIYPLKKYMTHMGGDLTTLSYCLIIIPATIILAFLCVESYKKFKTKMNSLNLN